MTAEMTTRADGGPLEFTAEQRQMIRDAYANGASDAEFRVLMEVASARRINPLLRQVHFVKRWNSDLKRETWTVQVSIDGLRTIAQRTGLYDGQDEPEFVEREGDKYPTLCRVRVYRKDWQRPSVGVAYWNEYVQKTRDGGVSRMWAQMPHVMLAKVAESIALRKAFPEDTSGIYSSEEMMQADREDEPVAEQRRERPRVVANVRAESPALPSPARVSLDGLGIETPAKVPTEAQSRDSMAQTILARIAEIELPGESVAVWMKHRDELTVMPMADREGVWRALCERTAAVGKMKDARVWLKKAIADEDERRKANADEDARIIAERARSAYDTTAGSNPTLGEHNVAIRAGLFESMADAIANARSLDALAKVAAKVETRINELGPSEAATIRTMLADRRAVLSQQPPPDGTTGGRRAKSGTHLIADGAGEGAASDGDDGPTAWLRDAATCRAHVATKTHIAALMASARKHASAIAARPYAVLAYAERAACLDPMLSADQWAETFSSPVRKAA